MVNGRHLFTGVNINSDYSTSSCPPSASSEDTTSEGYLVLSFNNSKPTKLITESFTNVSDDLDEENVEEDEWLSVESGNATENLGTSHPTNLIPDVKPINSDQFGSCYGEAVWVGNVGLPVSHPHNAQVSHVNGKSVILPSQSQSPCLVRTSPLKDRSVLCSQNQSFKMHPNRFGGQPHVVVNHINTANSTVKRAPFRNLPLSVRLASKHSRTTPGSSQSYEAGSFSGQHHKSTHDGFARTRKMLRCGDCGKYYRNEYSLQHHICLKRKDVWKKGDVPTGLVDGQLIYHCPTCAKPFKWLGNLTRHYYVHTGQRFFKCDVCFKEFFSAYQVKRHMNSHTGVRFKCEICLKPFTCKYACKWHTRQHYNYSAIY